MFLVFYLAFFASSLGHLVVIFLGFPFAWSSVGNMYSSCWFWSQTARRFEKKSCCPFVVFSSARFRAFVVVVMEKIHRKCKALFRSRGCLGCCSQPRLLIPVNEPSNGLRIQGQSVRKNSISEDFWSTSTIEMENNGIQFQKSISSISTSNPLDSHGTSGSTSNTPEFVNHGLLLWNQTRNLWLANKQPQRQTQLREPRISWNATYESLLGTNKPFRQPIPLPEMIDFLVDIWEQDGLYD